MPVDPQAPVQEAPQEASAPQEGGGAQDEFMKLLENIGGGLTAAVEVISKAPVSDDSKSALATILGQYQEVIPKILEEMSGGGQEPVPQESVSQEAGIAGDRAQPVI